MTPDLKYLLFSVILTFVQVLIAASLANNAVGLTTLAGNREGMGELPGMAGRAKRIKFICILGSEQGARAFAEVHPDVPVFAAAIDAKLNDHGYIVPGLGDAGDRLFGTK